MKTFLKEVLLPFLIALCLAAFFKPVYMVDGVCDYFLMWLCIGFPFGIRRMCLWLVPFGYGISGKSMHYNPFAYIRSEKDILKLVNTIIVNTKGDGDKSGEDFWVKAEKLYYTALIGYIWYEAPHYLARIDQRFGGQRG